MKSFKLLILTVGIISNIFAYDAFCSDSKNTTIDFYDINEKSVTLNIPTQNFFTKYYNRFSGKKYSSNDNLYKQVSIKKSLIEKYPVLKQFINTETPEEYNSDKKKQMLDEIASCHELIKYDKNVNPNDRTILSNVCDDIIRAHKNAYSRLLDAAFFGF